MRELLLFPPAWVAWFESVAKSGPPERPLTNAISTAGPEGWNPPPEEVGLPKGPRINFPFWLNTRMSGVKGLFTSNSPPGHNVSSLHTLGRPCPDSRTNTWKLLALPRKAMPVGALRPATKTAAVDPGGGLIEGGRLGLKNAVLFMQSGAVDGFDTVCALVTVGSAKSG